MHNLVASHRMCDHGMIQVVTFVSPSRQERLEMLAAKFDRKVMFSIFLNFCGELLQKVHILM